MGRMKGAPPLSRVTGPTGCWSPRTGPGVQGAHAGRSGDTPGKTYELLGKQQMQRNSAAEQWPASVRLDLCGRCS